MNTIAISTDSLKTWSRLLKAVRGQVSENMRPCQGKTDTLFTLDNICAGMDAALASPTKSTPNTGGWDENSRFYGVE